MGLEIVDDLYLHDFLRGLDVFTNWIIVSKRSLAHNSGINLSCKHNCLDSLNGEQSSFFQRPLSWNWNSFLVHNLLPLGYPSVNVASRLPDKFIPVCFEFMSVCNRKHSESEEK